MLPIGATHAANHDPSSPAAITQHRSHCPSAWIGQCSLSPLLYTATLLCCRGRITLHGRTGVDLDQLNFPLDDYTDEEIPDSIEALQDAIKLDQVSAKLCSACLSVWLTAQFPATILQQALLPKSRTKDAALLSLHHLNPQSHSPAAYTLLFLSLDLARVSVCSHEALHGAGSVEGHL